VQQQDRCIQYTADGHRKQGLLVAADQLLRGREKRDFYIHAHEWQLGELGPERGLAAEQEEKVGASAQLHSHQDQAVLGKLILQTGDRIQSDREEGISCLEHV